jgi:DNA repair exonuclease SbcCD ATPase subunit
MHTNCRILLVCVAAISLSAATANAQDEPSLGDLARQQRQQKQQAKAAPGKDAKSAKVITNEELPAHAATPSTSTSATSSGGPTSPPDSASAPKVPAEQWKSQILSQKNQIASLQSQIDQLNESIRFAPANCVENCASWNERQKEKQQQVERMQAQLEEQKKRLDEMQESARRQGYGSSVYDP